MLSFDIGDSCRQFQKLIHPVPKYSALSVTEGDCHSKSRGDILFQKMYQESEATQDLKTGRNVPWLSLTMHLSLGNP